MKALRLFIALHHHRHGMDVHLYHVPPGIAFTADDVIERLGEEFEKDRDERIELEGPFDDADIIDVDPNLIVE